MSRDPSLDALLELDGQILVVDPNGHYWVRFGVRRVPASAERPHGLDYSLTLHRHDGVRLVGFDNAHPIRTSAGPGGGQRRERDHKHRLKTVGPYDFQDAGQLLADFWAEVEAVLREHGVTS